VAAQSCYTPNADEVGLPLKDIAALALLKTIVSVRDALENVPNGVTKALG
jgi:hypothetical protein